MTKKYMNFNEFKHLILEEDEKNPYWPGGVLWQINYAAKKAVFYFAILKTEDKRNETYKVDLCNVSKSDSLVSKLKEVLKTESKDPSKVWNIEQGEKVTDSRIDLRTYDLYKFECTLNKNYRNSNSSKDEIVEKLANKCKETINNFNSQNKRLKFIIVELRTTNIDNLYKEIDTKLREMKDHPDTFSGYNSIKGNFKKLQNMPWLEFLDEFGRDGILGALVAKGILNMLKPGKEKKKDNKDKNDNSSSNEPATQTTDDENGNNTSDAPPQQN